MDDPLYSLPAVMLPPEDYKPTVSQFGYARLLMDPSGPQTDKGREEYLGLDPGEIQGWLTSPRFRAWLAYQTEVNAGPLCMELWRGIFAMARDETDPARRLEAARLFLGRFDPGVRTAGRDVRRAVGDFAKTLAKEAVAKAGPRTVHATILHGS